MVTDCLMNIHTPADLVTLSENILRDDAELILSQLNGYLSDNAPALKGLTCVRVTVIQPLRTNPSCYSILGGFVVEALLAAGWHDPSCFISPAIMGCRHVGVAASLTLYAAAKHVYPTTGE